MGREEKCNVIQCIIDLNFLGCFVDKVNMSVLEETEIKRQLDKGFLEDAYNKIC